MTLLERMQHATHSPHFDHALEAAVACANHMPRRDMFRQLLAYIAVSGNEGGLIFSSVFAAFHEAVKVYYDRNTNNPGVQNLWDTFS